MSNTTRYDSFLSLHLARELNQQLAGRACTFAAFDRERSQFLLGLGEQSLRWDLRTALPAIAPAVADDANQLPLPRKPVLSEISALWDERILRLAISGGQRSNAIRYFMIELLPVHRNVIALDASRKIVKLLMRGSSARPLLRGKPYVPPAARERLEPTGLDAWRLLLGEEPAEWPQRYIDQVAYASPINVRAVTSAETLEQLATRYEAMRNGPVEPCLLLDPAGQPYPHRLWQNAQRTDSLLAALNDARNSAADEPVTRLQKELLRHERKLDKLQSEWGEAAAEAHVLRGRADLLLAHAHGVARGAQRAEVTDFNGEPAVLELDAALSAFENAQAWYEAARKRERAAERLPQLIAATQADLERTRSLLERARAGEQVDLPPAPQRRRPADAPALPYRTYRTSGGLEVRVGRSSRANDQLTLHHSSPNDIWLHARDVGGAHVVLRWANATENPPRQDLIEAAVLAAQHSKARHSRTVPVDWTRRKYVRKPRHAPAGQVWLERAETVFVQMEEE